MKLSYRSSGKVVYVNKDHVELVDDALDGQGGSRIVFNQNHALVVAESPDEVHCQMNKIFSAEAPKAKSRQRKSGRRPVAK